MHPGSAYIQQPLVPGTQVRLTKSYDNEQTHKENFKYLPFLVKEPMKRMIKTF